MCDGVSKKDAQWRQQQVRGNLSLFLGILLVLKCKQIMVSWALVKDCMLVLLEIVYGCLVNNGALRPDGLRRVSSVPLGVAAWIYPKLRSLAYRYIETQVSDHAF